MAIQQVKFHSVTQANYDSATKTDGSLYFIVDNGEIRKGENHITGTRVYNAVDSTGTTKVENLPITFGGTSITSENFPTDNLPKKGDMLVVEHTLVAASGTEGQAGYVPAKKEYAAYIYAANGGTYSASNWQACDGNVDASKVILTETYTLAGDYDKVGNLVKGNDYNANGKSVADALRDIFTKELDNSTKSNPTLSITGSNQTLEIGSVHPATTYTATWADGSYSNKAYWGANDLRDATGTVPGAWTITAYDGKTNANATINETGTTASITTDAFTVTSTSTTTIANFSVVNDRSNTKKAATNLGNEGTVVINTASVGGTMTVSGFRYWFWGSTTDPDKDYTSNTSGVATATSNWNIRQLAVQPSGVKGGKGTSLSSMATIADARQFVIAIPSTKKITKVQDGGNKNEEIQDLFTVTTMKLGGADSTSSSVGSYATQDYKVYVFAPAAKWDARTFTITIGNA